MSLLENLRKYKEEYKKIEERVELEGLACLTYELFEKYFLEKKFLSNPFPLQALKKYMYKNGKNELYEKFANRQAIKELRRLQKSDAELAPYDR